MRHALLHHAFEATAARLPGKTALVCGTRRLAYREVQARVQRLASRLCAAGVARGDRVVVMLEADIEYAVAVHAVLRIGAVLVPLAPTTKADKLAFVIEDTEASALLTEARLEATWGPARERCAGLRRLLLAATFDDDADADLPRDEAAAQDLAALLYTSGSTGRPKGVMLSHHNMTSAWAAVQAYLGLRESDVIGLALPPTYSYGLYHLLMGLGLGATVVIERQAAFPVKLAETLEREAVTVFPAVPSLFAALLDTPAAARFDHRALRIVSNAAAALPTSHIERIRRRWPQARLYCMYGMTECKRISYLPPEELERRPGSVGRGMPMQEHWLVDEANRRLPHGSTGQLVVSGPHVMQGYWRRPQETAERLGPGPREGERVLYTGDLFRSDDEGYLYFVARMDDIIKTGGEKVAPREVEDAIHQLEGVTGCAVIGVPDARLGQTVKAYVTLRADAAVDARAVIRHCQARLESHMVPKTVEIVQALPMTESGKVRHAALREAEPTRGSDSA